MTEEVLCIAEHQLHALAFRAKPREDLRVIRTMFDEELVLSGDKRRLFVTLGQFSIIRLERDAQLVVPVLEYSLPTKECCDTPGCAEDPCEMFSRIPFPAKEFSPKSCDRQSDTTAPGCSCYQTT